MRKSVIRGTPYGSTKRRCEVGIAAREGSGNQFTQRAAWPAWEVSCGGCTGREVSFFPHLDPRDRFVDEL